MKTLILMRHATAAAQITTDFERLLELKGEQEAFAAGDFLVQQHLVPDVIICSPSRRTTRTFELVRRNSWGKTEVHYEQTLYDNDPDRLLGLIGGVPSGCGCLMIIGHNPSIGELASELTDSKGYDGHFPPAALAVIRFEVSSWAEMGTKKGTLKLFHQPEHF